MRMHARCASVIGTWTLLGLLATTSPAVVIDPTYTAAVTVSIDAPSPPYNTSLNYARAMQAWYATMDSAILHEERGLFEFSITGIAADSITSAHFRPYVSDLYDTFNYNTQPVIHLYGFVGAGSIDPAFSAPSGSELCAPILVTATGYLDIDVTSFVQTLASQGKTNIGFLITADHEYTVLAFNGGSYTSDPLSELVIAQVPETATIVSLSASVAALMLKRRKR